MKRTTVRPPMPPPPQPAPVAPPTSGPRRVVLAGRPLVLKESQLLRAGGEGAVYGVGDRAYKIYHNPATAMPAAKLAELAVLTRDEVVRPEALLTDAAGTVVGYVMPLVRDGQPLPPLFTKAFRQAHRITPGRIFKLVLAIRDVMADAHRCRLLLVDPNELNWLASRDLARVRAIDVDSWQTPSFPAQFIMDHVRDRHAARDGVGFWAWDATTAKYEWEPRGRPVWTEGTDWFSFAVLATQLLVGIHPYRGRHPDCHPADPDERLDTRMKRNLSVFNPDTVLNAACYPVDDVPGAYHDWLTAVLERGDRSPAPATGDRVVHVVVPAVRPAAIPSAIPAGGFDWHSLGGYVGNAVSLLPVAAGLVVLCDDGAVRMAGGRQIAVTDLHAVGLARTPGGRLVVVYENKGYTLAGEPNGTFLFSNLGRPMTTLDGRLFAVSPLGNVVEADWVDLPSGQVAAGVRNAGDVLPAADLYPGVIVQRIFAGTFATLVGTGVHARLDDLADYRVIDAAADGSVLAVTAQHHATGRTDRFVYRANSFGTISHPPRVTRGVHHQGLRVVALPKGVAVIVHGAGEAEVVPTDPSRDGVRIVADPRLDPSVPLARRGDEFLAARDGSVFRLTLT